MTRSASSGVAARPVPIAQIGSYAITTRSSEGTSASAARTWDSTQGSVRPSALISRLSPTQRITRRFAASAARTFRFTSASVSWKCCRRSECPTIT